jgi:hypothetical protein
VPFNNVVAAKAIGMNILTVVTGTCFFHMKENNSTKARFKKSDPLSVISKSLIAVGLMGQEP